MMKVSEIVVKWLEENRYDGLVSRGRDCGCELSDLMPCDMPCHTCEAGHKKEADPSTGWDFLICPGKGSERRGK